MTQEEEIRRGMEAQRLMEEPLLVEAFAAIERGLLEQMRRVNLADHKANQAVLSAWQCLGTLRSQLYQAIQTGALAEISKRESLTSRVKRAFKG